MKKLIEYFLQFQKLFRVVFWLWTGFVIFMSLKPKTKSSITLERIYNFRLDYSIHFVVYFCWMLAMGFAYQNFIRTEKKQRIGLLAIVSLLFTYATEYAQHYTPGRVYNPFDFLCNLLGVISAYLFLRSFKSEFKNQY